MKVELLHITPLEILIKAIRKCYDSMERSDSQVYDSGYDGFDLGPKDKALIQQIIDSGHHVPLEMINLTYDVTGLSRACMLEVEKHRLTSITCKSSRYTLKKDLKNEETFEPEDWKPYDYERASKYVVLTGNPNVDGVIVQTLEEVRKLTQTDIPNDVLKYALGDAYKLDFTININVRSLRNLFKLRDHERALWEYQDLSREMYQVIPEDYKFLFADCVREA